MPTGHRQKCCPSVLRTKAPTPTCGHALTTILAVFSDLLVAAEKSLFLGEGPGELPKMVWLLTNLRAFFLCWRGCSVAVYFCASP